MTVFQPLYDSEINFLVSCFWDGGFYVALGDEMNGFRDRAEVYTWAEVEPWLKAAAKRHFPESKFAKETQNE